MCARARARGVLAWRGSDIHTLDGKVKCVLHTCMTFEAAPGIARKGVGDACYFKWMTYNLRHVHTLRPSACVRVCGADAAGPVPCRHVVVIVLPSIS